jgi:CBS domain-containing protein
MRITEVLATKGTDVVSVPPDCDVAGLLAVLAERGIGAAVVSADGATVEGIVSERDVVRALAARGAAVLQEPVGQICTVDVHTVGPDTAVDELMRIMTERRIRHVPVVADGVLRGIVSIGDVVKRHMSALEDERSALSSYITAGG